MICSGLMSAKCDSTLLCEFSWQILDRNMNLSVCIVWKCIRTKLCSETKKWKSHNNIRCTCFPQKRKKSEQWGIILLVRDPSLRSSVKGLLSGSPGGLTHRMQTRDFAETASLLCSCLQTPVRCLCFWQLEHQNGTGLKGSAVATWDAGIQNRK